MVYNVGDLPVMTPMSGFRVRFVHALNMTLAFWEIDANAELPLHSHPHEQVANVVDGEFSLTINGKTQYLKAGTVAVIPPNAPHAGRALTACRITDVFYPVREDYRTLSSAAVDRRGDA
jgi:quercetin dioxygenase-like cupin family protein